MYMLSQEPRCSYRENQLGEVICQLRFPEILAKQPHVAYKVDNADPYLAEADRIIFGPEALGDNVRLAFIIKDDAIIELYEEK